VNCMRKKIIIFFLLAGSIACASAPAPQPDKPPGDDATGYYPLAVGNTWTYVLRGSEKRETIAIVGRDGPWFLDDHRGRLRYESDGVRDADRYLLHTPLSAGAKWSSVDNLIIQRFEVTATDASAVTEAGTFTHCAVVRNEQVLPKGGKFVTEWTYAPRVGMVRLVTSTIDSKGQQQEQTRLQLVAYHLQ
jgi:hypothetical protein